MFELSRRCPHCYTIADTSGVCPDCRKPLTPTAEEAAEDESIRVFVERLGHRKLLRNVKTLLILSGIAIAIAIAPDAWRNITSISVVRQKPTPPAQSQPTAETQENPQSVTVYITSTGKRYHLAGCQYLRGGRTAVTVKEARDRGYKPCTGCNPPR